MVLAIVQPFKLDAVTLALENIAGFGGMTVSDCRGFGRGKVAEEDDAVDRGNSVSTARSNRPVVQDFTKKTRIEIAVHGRTLADAIVEAIARTAHTGRRGDGKVFLWPVARAVRVRTLETDVRAL